jgi:hypothetical protein
MSVVIICPAQRHVYVMYCHVLSNCVTAMTQLCKCRPPAMYMNAPETGERFQRLKPNTTWSGSGANAARH